MWRKIIQRFNTFSETNHDIEYNVPVLMTEIYSHFLFFLFKILMLGLFINDVVLDLQLFKFGRTEFFLFVFKISVLTAVVKKFVNILKHGLNIFHELNTRVNFILFLLFLATSFYFTYLASILTELMVVLEKTFEWDVFWKWMIG